MTHHLIFFIAFTMIATTSCYAMEQQPIFKELTIAQLPQQAIYLTNNRVAISDKQGCSIVDPITEKEILKISNKEYPHIAIHPNKQKIALSYGKSVKIYNTLTGKKEWKSQHPLLTDTKRPQIITTQIPVEACAFSPLNDTLFISYKGSDWTTCHNYYDQTVTLTGSNCPSRTARIITLHPTQDHVCYARNPGRIDIDDKKTPYGKVISHVYEMHNFCEYSPDGSLIVAGNQNNIYTIDPNSNKQQSLPMEKNEPVMQIRFHPNSTVLAKLSNINHVVSYWDIQTSQLICAIPPLYSQHCDYFSKKYNLSFSPDGKNLLVTIPEKCIVMPVPFEAIYQTDAIKTVLPIYWALKQYHLNQSTTLPHDTTYVIMHMLLAMLKR